MSQQNHRMPYRQDANLQAVDIVLDTVMFQRHGNNEINQKICYKTTAQQPHPLAKNNTSAPLHSRDVRV